MTPPPDPSITPGDFPIRDDEPNPATVNAGEELRSRGSDPAGPRKVGPAAFATDVQNSGISADVLAEIPKIMLPRHMSHQEPILVHNSRFKVCCCGRRWGKTVLGLIAVIEGHGPRGENGIPQFPGAMYGATIWWVCPTYKISNQIWRDLKRCLQDAWLSKSEVERRITLPGGGSITLSSTDNPDSLRGSGIDGLVVDEAAYVKEEAWTEALRPSLSDRQGWGIFISTPDGRNWFWKLFERAGQASRASWNRWQRPTSDNPIMTAEELKEAQEDLGPQKYAQEYEAQFITPGQHQVRPEWFRYFDVDPNTNFYHLADPDGDEKLVAQDDLFRFATTDLATSLSQTADFSVVTVFGVTPRAELLVLDVTRSRMQGPDHIAMLQRVYKKWRPSFIAIERTGFQLSVVQAAIQSGLPVRGVPADKDKVSRAGNVLARMSAGTVYFRQGASWLSDWESELLSFPRGDHDDQMDTLSMAGILLAERPGKRVLFPDVSDLEKAFDLPSKIVGDFLDPTDGGKGINDSWNPEIDSDLDDDFIGEVGESREWPWQVANGSSVETILASVDPSFIGDASTIWHAHLAVEPSGAGASLSLARIVSWKRVLSVVEGAPMEVEIPIYEVPLTLRIIAPRMGHLSLGACGDIVIALRQVRRFNITSVSVSGFHSAGILQKLVRAGLVTTGTNINPHTGAPEASGAPVSVDKQAYTDLKLAVLEGRAHLMSYGWSFRELSQLEDQGSKISGIRNTADSVAGAVGHLARFGHFVLEQPGEGFLSLDDFGLSMYSGLQY